jgi:hypothetical protein
MARPESLGGAEGVAPSRGRAAGPAPPTCRAGRRPPPRPRAVPVPARGCRVSCAPLGPHHAPGSPPKARGRRGAARGQRRRWGAGARGGAGRPPSPGPPCVGGLPRLTLDAPCPGRTRAARGLAPGPTPGIVPPLPAACPAPRPARLGDGLVGWKRVREQAPWASAPPPGAKGMHPRTPRGRARATTALSGGNERCQARPGRCGEIGERALPHPVPSTPQVLRGPTSYHANHFADRL